MPEVAGSAIGAVGGAFVAQLALLVSGVIAARLLGPEDRGYFALMTLVPTALSALMLFGSSTAMAYFLARFPAQASAIIQVLAPAAIVQLLLCVVIQCLIVLLLVREQSQSHQLAGIVSIVAGPAIILQQYGLSALQGLQEFRPYNVLRVFPAGSYSILLVITVAFGGTSLFTVTFVWVLASVLSAILILLAALRAIPDVKSPVTTVQQREILRLGAKGFLGSSAPLESFRLDQLAVGLFLAPAQLGLYVASLAFTNLPRFIAQSLGVVALPYIASQSSHQQAQKAMWRFFAVTLLGSGMFAVSLASTAPFLIPFVFGADFRQAVTPTQLLLLAAVLHSTRRILSDGLRGMGHAGIGSTAEVVSWGILLPLLALLAPRSAQGLNGVAIASGSAASVGMAFVLVAAIQISHRTPAAQVLN